MTSSSDLIDKATGRLEAMQASGHIDSFARDNLPKRELWPDFPLTLPELAYPPRLNCAAELLDKAAAGTAGDKVAIYTKNRTVTYGELLFEANHLAHYLVDEMGVEPGNRVLLHGANSIELIAAWYAVMKVGAIAVMTMPMLRAGELAKVIRKGCVSHALCDGKFEEVVRDAAGQNQILRTIECWGANTELVDALGTKPDRFINVDTARDDVALLAFTSGTTGEPKACAHFHSSVLAMADTFSKHTLVPEVDEICVGTPPFAFTFGLGACVVFPARAGLSIALPDRPGFEALCETIEAFGVTTVFTAPTGYRALLSQWDTYDLSSLRKGISAGEHLPAATSDAFYKKTGIRLIDGIGATEMIHIFISAAGDAIIPGATGQIVPGYEGKIINDKGDEVAAGEIGRLAVRGPTGCLYLADDRQAQYVLDGWNVTGDLYRRDADGYYWYVSRADDLIVSSGYNIAGPEVEQALLSHAGVAECAVVGMPHADRGSVVKAFIVLKEPDNADAALVKALQDHVKQEIAPYKYPREIEFIETLPKTLTGKIQRYKLR
jgi:2-aminobenzoate-CoA ligase